MAAVKILVWFITILVLVFLVGFRDMIKTGNSLMLVFYLKPKVATASVLKVSFRLVNHSTHDLLYYQSSIIQSLSRIQFKSFNGWL